METGERPSSSPISSTLSGVSRSASVGVIPVDRLERERVRSASVGVIPVDRPERERVRSASVGVIR